MIKQVSSQNIDDLIQGIESIIENRCSLLDEDRKLLFQTIILLKKYKQRNDVTDVASLLLIVKAVSLLTKFFV
ncbi:hypothetical protein A8C56_12285 [Niabella ginsenosidivorans]|uniref:Uncharacterized protein n=1 Tax=Niabella ginsenosidivorans TaxID=1176587 RepID=A0A1A9I527_9BACT|nr:hypothetical protein [Niabella ginsenosidivorans]ANH81654.1 hypothetical protein A8C56_12285 [Niabella ginsenosidivorans]